jgi:hypothetical protein
VHRNARRQPPEDVKMWKWFNCYLSGRHDYGMWCEPGTIFLRCMHCGKRSPGWSVDAKAPKPRAAVTLVVDAATSAARVLPFERATAR